MGPVPSKADSMDPRHPGDYFINEYLLKPPQTHTMIPMGSARQLKKKVAEKGGFSFLWLDVRPVQEDNTRCVRSACAEECELPEDRERVLCAFYNGGPDCDRLVVLCHDTDEGIAIPLMRSRMHLLSVTFRAHVIAPEYQGYLRNKCCISYHTPSVSMCGYDAFRCVYRMIRLGWTHDKMILVGHGFGCGPVLGIFERRASRSAYYQDVPRGEKFGGILLLAPFASVREWYREQVAVPWAGRMVSPDLWNLQTEFPPLTKGHKIMIVHGSDDTRIKPRHSRTLYDSIISHYKGGGGGGGEEEKVRLVMVKRNHDLLDRVVGAALFMDQAEEFFLPPNRPVEVGGGDDEKAAN